MSDTEKAPFIDRQPETTNTTTTIESTPPKLSIPKLRGEKQPPNPNSKTQQRKKKQAAKNSTKKENSQVSHPQLTTERPKSPRNNGPNSTPPQGGVPPGNNPSSSNNGTSNTTQKSVKPKHPRYVDLAEWALAHTLRINQQDDLITYCKNQQWKHVIIPEIGTRTHPISHFSREKALMFVLAQIGRGRTSAHIVDFFGSHRNKGFRPELLAPGNRHLSVNWSSYAPSMVQGDVARGFHTTRTPHFPLHSDAVLIQDVYMAGKYRLTPSIIRELAELTNMQSVYIIVRMFHGEAGMDDLPGEEGAWIRHENGLITFSPDKTNVYYAPHPDLNFLLDRTVDGLDIALLTQLGPYHIFRCSPSAAHAIPLQPPNYQPPIVFNRVTIPVPGIWTNPYLAIEHWIRKTTDYLGITSTKNNPFRTLFIHSTIAQQLSTTYGSKTAHGLLFDNTLSTVRAALDKDPVMQKLQKRFFLEHEQIIFDTTLFVLYGQREHITHTLALARSTFMDLEVVALNARSRTPQFEERSWKRKLIMLAGMAIVGLYGYQALKSLARGNAPRLAINAAGAFFDVISSQCQQVAVRLQLMLSSVMDQTRKWAFMQPFAAMEIDKNDLTQVVVKMTPQLYISDLFMEIPKTLFHLFDFNYQWPLGNDWWIHPITVVIGAPFVEELFRGTWLNYLFFIETATHLINAFTTKQTMFFVPIAMHLFNSFSGIPYLYRVGIHAAWNLLAVNEMNLRYSYLRDQVGVPFMVYFENLYKCPASAASLGLLTLLFAGCSYLLYRFYTTKDPRTNTPHYTEMLQHREECIDTIPQTSITEYLPFEARIPSTIAKFKNFEDYHFRPELVYRITYRKIPLTLSQAMVQIQENQVFTPSFIYPILITNGLSYRPQLCLQNELIAMMERTWADPYYGIVALEDRKKYEEQIIEMWKWIADLFEDEMGLIGYTTLQLQSMTFLEGVRLMGKKGKRIYQAKQTAILHGDLPAETSPHFSYKKNVNLKHDEIIPPKDMGGFSTIKPRAIIDFSPELHYRMSSVSRDISAIMHEIFQFENIFNVGDYRVRFVYASGYTASELSELGNAMTQSPDIVVLVAGDDSLVSWGDSDIGLHYGAQFLESDQTKYDHTQGVGPCQIFLTRWLRMFKIPEWFIEICVDSLKRSYSVSKKDGKDLAWKFVFMAGTQLASGSMMTTNINSMDCIIMYWSFIHAYSHYLKNPDSLDPSFNIEQHATDIGFIVKTKWHYSIHDGTFLKGWFVPIENGYVAWLPLPSALLKLGKMLVTPTSISVGHGKADPEIAIRQCAYALARSPGIIPPSYPLLGPFIEKLLELSIPADVMLPERYKRLKVAPLSSRLDRRTTLTMICDRYSCTVKDILEVEAMISAVRTLPACLFHPLFVTLRDIDYG